MRYQLISRKGCHLCEEAEELLGQIQLPFEWLDVDVDQELKNRYTFRVPVLLREGKVLMEGKFTFERLSRKISEV